MSEPVPKEILEELVEKRLADIRGEIKFGIKDAIEYFRLANLGHYRWWIDRAKIRKIIKSNADYLKIKSNKIVRKERLKKIIAEMWNMWRQKGVTRKQVCDEYGIPKDRFSKKMRLGIKMELFDEEQYKKILKEKYIMGWNTVVETHRDFLSNAGKKGGTAVQKNAPYVVNNLDDSKPYGSTGFYYKGVRYRSKGEFKLGLMFKYSGKISDTILGKNFQINCNGLRIDYVIKINGKEYAIDFHRNNRNEDKFNDINYAKTRPEKLRERGWEGPVEIFGPLGWFYKFLKLGIVQNHNQYRRIKEKAEKELETAMSLIKAGVPDSWNVGEEHE